MDVPTVPTEAIAPLTLAIDIGGTGLKAGVLDVAGRLVGEHRRALTPRKGTPAAVVEALLVLTGGIGQYDRVSIGFPGVVRQGRVLTAPNLDSESWRHFPLAATLAEKLERPARMLNDAEVQGLGVISSQGLECVVTLGTGMGFSLFQDGHLAPHLELAHHPVRGDKTYDQYIGNSALRKVGRKRWNRRVQRALRCITDLVGFDLLYVGGGNAKHIRFELPANARIVSNEAGLTGGVRVWDRTLDAAFAVG